MTCTDTISPTVDAVSAPASVAALTAPTSPWMTTDTSPSPTSSRPMMLTLAALTMASAAASAATYPLVSIIPSAFSAITVLLSCAGRRGCSRLVDRADDQRIDGGMILEPARCDRAGGDQHPLADAAAEHVERDQLRAALHLDLEEGPVRDVVDSLRRPHGAGHPRSQHRRSFPISTPRLRARSRAMGVSTARGASTMRAPLSAASRTWRSVTAPFSIRSSGPPPGAWEAPPPASEKRRRPEMISMRSRGFSRRRASWRTKEIGRAPV